MTGLRGVTGLRIGLLGASRIAELAVTAASEETGDIRAAVAARDPERARAYAAAQGYEGIHESYEALIADDSLDLVYIGLPNGLHAEWTARALDAGRNVLVEKPFAANLAEFDLVVAHLEGAAGWAWEGFHYADHPAMELLTGVIRSGEIGEIREIDVHMDMPSPAPEDPRWNFDLAGGTMMDLGCYALNVLLFLGDELAGDGVFPAAGAAAVSDAATAGAPAAVQAPVLRLVPGSATAVRWETDERLDATVVARFDLGGAAAAVHTSMVSADWNFALRVTGSRGEVTLPNFVKPQEDDRLIVSSGSDSGAGAARRVDRAGASSSYVHQLRTLRDAVRSGERAEDLLARSRRTMALIDEVYTACGLPLRPGRMRDSLG